MDNQSHRLAAAPDPAPVSLWRLCWLYLKIGMTGLGPAFLVETQQQLVKKLRLLSEQDFINGLALAQLLPGATYVSLTVYLGFKLRGIKGAVVSFFAFLLPSFIVMLLLSMVYFSFGARPIVHVLFTGMTVVMAGLLPYTSLNIAKSVLSGWRDGLLFAFGFGLSLYDSNVLILLLAAALSGVLLNGLARHRPARAQTPPTMRNEPYTPGKQLLWLLTASAIGLFAALLLVRAFQPMLLQLIYVFARMGTLLFGGGSAMIPFMQQEVVAHYHWLSLNQFMVGITLGQITPGPFLITATFVGYKVAAISGAIASALSIFLPSLFLVIAVAGVHERIQHNHWVQAAIKGIAAAFAGMLWVVAGGLIQHAVADIPSALIALAVFGAMLSGKLQTPWVILLGTGAYGLWMMA